MSGGKIYEFNPQVYPTRLWVAVNPVFKDAEKKFYFLDENDEVVDDAHDVFDVKPSTIATTIPAAHKENGWRGVLIAVWRKNECKVGVIAHEATHATDWLCEQLGIECHSFMDGEPRAYYTQWVANCVEEVLKKKK